MAKCISDWLRASYRLFSTIGIYNKRKALGIDRTFKFHQFLDLQLDNAWEVKRRRHAFKKLVKFQSTSIS